MHRRRSYGILLHPTSLPGPGGIGSLGAEAHGFVDFLAEAGCDLWQLLPLGPTAYGNSPYSSYSAFAGNPLLIDLRELVADGDLDETSLKERLPRERVDYPRVARHKLDLLRQGATAFFATNDRLRMQEFWDFCDTTPWLHDYALFMALKEHFDNKGWWEWPEEVARRHSDALHHFDELVGPLVGFHKYLQWRFFRQWQRLREYAGERGVRIIGDLPIFVALDSADVWSHARLFQLDTAGRPTMVAGVPPDYFSATGQLWGNPLYNWEAMEQEGFAWWIDRFRQSFALFDLLRVDHFRGFEACWQVPATETTAINGQWHQVPGERLFEAVHGTLGRLPIIAEDLGVITPAVEELRDRFAFPGMKILQFAFGSGPRNPYLLHNHIPRSVVYTGTHDNDTTMGWEATLPTKTRRHLKEYLGERDEDPPWGLIRVTLASVSEMAIVPMQDLLSLSSEARMNIPGQGEGNWEWRLHGRSLTSSLAKRFRELAAFYGRGEEENNLPASGVVVF